MTAFVDGDRGGNLIIKELTTVTDLDFVSKAPDGKEVEELTKKEIHKAIRGRITAEQAKLDLAKDIDRIKPVVKKQFSPAKPSVVSSQQRFKKRIRNISEDEKKKFKSLLEDLIGTKGAYILDEKLSVLGKVPISELSTTIKLLKGCATAF